MKQEELCFVTNCLMLPDVVEQFIFSPFGFPCYFFAGVCKDHCIQIHQLEYSKHPSEFSFCCYNDCNIPVSDNADDFSCIMWKSLTIAGELPLSGRSFFCKEHAHEFLSLAEQHDIEVDE